MKKGGILNDARLRSGALGSRVLADAAAILGDPAEGLVLG
jgi:hypothetical protein